MTRPASFNVETDEIALTHGSWQLNPRTRVLVWVQAPAPIKADPIACPTCYATIYQACSTTNGGRTKDHAARETPRACPCGNPPSYRAIYCSDCRSEEKRASNRGYKRRAADRKWAERIAA